MQHRLRLAVGRLLGQLRTRRKLTLQQVEDLTRKLGTRVSRSRLSQIERGEVPVTLDDVQVLCRVYGVGLVDLFLEVLAAAPADRFPPERSSKQLFEEGERLYEEGQVLEAAWAFDAAAERTEEPQRRALCLISAGHCYDRHGSLPLAIRRVEQALDLLDEDSEIAWRATAKLSVLLAASGATIRARAFLDRVLDCLARSRHRGPLRAYLQDAAATALGKLGETERSLALARRAARSYFRLERTALAVLKLAGAARLAARQGKMSTARELAREVERLLPEIEEKYASAFARLAVGVVRAADEEVHQARALFREAWGQAVAHGFRGLALEAAEELACLEECLGGAAEARRWRRQVRAVPGERAEAPPELLSAVAGTDGLLAR